MKFAKCYKYKNPIRIFSQSELEKIHLATMEIMEEIGVKILDGKTLDFLSGKGLKVDFDNKLVKMDRDLIDSCIKKVPSLFSLYSQNGDEMVIGEGRFFVVSMVEESYIIDVDTHKRREAKLSDIIETVRLIDQLPYYHICCNPVIAHDVDPRLSIIYSAAEIYKNTTKNCLVVPSTGQEARFIIELGIAVAGSEKELTEKPILSISIAPSSPLKLPKNMCEVIWEYSKRKLPIIIVQAPMVGAASPVTIAGAMAQANAESLAALVLIQLINEGTPVVYGGAAVKFDLKTGFPAYGSIEYGLLSIATAQLGRYYNLSTYGAGGATSANITDAQAGYEKMSSTMLAYMAGHDILCDAGLNANGLISLESILIQNEIFAKVLRLSEKIEVNDETLALDTIKNVMAGSNFLSEDHTLKNMKTDFRYSNIGNRSTYEDWESKGCTDSIGQGISIAKEMLVNYKKHTLSKEQYERINKVLKRAEEEIL